MKTIVTALALLCQVLSVFSQVERLNKTFVFDTDNTIQTIIPTDSGYIIGGVLRNTVALIDSTANVGWSKSYPFSLTSWVGSISPNAMKKTSSNNFFSCGTIQNGTATMNKIFLNKYNPVFDTIYQKVLMTDTLCDGCLQLQNCFENSNGDYVLLGSDSKDSVGFYFNNNYTNGLILITDTLGCIKYHKTIGGIRFDDFYYGLQIANQYFFFGLTTSYASSSISGFDQRDALIVKTDIEGNEIASARFGHYDLYDLGFNYALPINGNKILTGHLYSYEKNAYGFIMSKPWLVILNSDLSIFKELFFRDASVSGNILSSMAFLHGLINSDSSFAFLGVDSKFNMSISSVISRKATITKMDNNYNILFNRYYTHNGIYFNELNPKTINSTLDGGYVIAGYVVDYSLNPIQQSWIVKTDSLGCDGFTSCNDTAMVMEILNYPDTLCKDSIYYITVRLKGRSAPYSLYANGTLALDSIYYPNTIPLWIDTLMPVALSDTGWQNLVVTLREPWERIASDTVQVYVRSCPTTANLTEYYKQKVEIYPNPATTELHVKIRGLIEGTYTISMFDTQGKTVDIITTKEQETVIDISMYQQGVYCVRVLGNNIVRSEKVIKLIND